VGYVYLMYYFCNDAHDDPGETNRPKARMLQTHNRHNNNREGVEPHGVDLMDLGRLGNLFQELKNTGFFKQIWYTVYSINVI
jgi:hypothetical protein